MGARLQGLVKEYLDDCARRGLAAGTRAGYACRLRSFVGHVGVRRRPAGITFADVAGWLAARMERVSDVADDRKSLAVFLNYCRRRRVLRGENPAAAELHRLPRPRYFRRHRTMMPGEDLALRRVACRRDVWPVVLLARWAGLRRGEACVARWCDVDLAQGAVDVPGHEGGRKHPRVVWLSPWVQLQLRSWMNDPTWPARPRDPVWPLHVRSADRRLAEICEAAELRRLTWNVLRASFVTDCFSRGMTAKEESLIVGHSPEIAERHYNEWLAREARSKLPPDPLAGVAARDGTEDGPSY